MPANDEGRRPMQRTRSPEGDPLAAGSQATIRPCREDEAETMVAIINSAAAAYRGVIPADCWHEPYMPAAELQSEIAAGIAFLGYEVDGVVAGVMGIQPVRNVDLIRHAYVLPTHQGRGIGSALIAHLRAQHFRPILVGTWTAATWAIRFYERHGFHLVPAATQALLLRNYWTISERQIETSVVLAAPRLTGEEARELVERAEAGRQTGIRKC
jgi:GNAT superfamily N-acetyltransferase